MGRAQLLQDGRDDALVIPSIKQTPDRLPGPEFLRQVAPSGASAQDPQNAIEDSPTITGWSPRSFPLGKNIPHALPRIVRQTISCHDRAFLGSVVGRSTNIMPRLP
jgi:hypothetical protein